MECPACPVFEVFLLMQSGCDRVSVSVTAWASAIVVVGGLLFENESQLQLEFQTAAASGGSIFGPIKGVRRRNRLARRTYFGEKSGCPRERAALLIANLVFEATLFREVPGRIPLLCSCLLCPILVGKSA